MGADRDDRRAQHEALKEGTTLTIKRVTQAELDAAWADLNTLPARARSLRKELAEIERRVAAASDTVSRARAEAEA